MSSERIGKEFVWHCDKCPEIFESEESNFVEGWSAAKRNGWVTFKLKDEWLHYCPACAEDN